jgi:hypothetical protein
MCVSYCTGASYGDGVIVGGVVLNMCFKNRHDETISNDEVEAVYVFRYSVFLLCRLSIFEPCHCMLLSVIEVVKEAPLVDMLM